MTNDHTVVLGIFPHVRIEHEQNVDGHLDKLVVISLGRLGRLAMSDEIERDRLEAEWGEKGQLFQPDARRAADAVNEK